MRNIFFVAGIAVFLLIGRADAADQAEKEKAAKSKAKAHTTRNRMAAIVAEVPGWKSIRGWARRRGPTAFSKPTDNTDDTDQTTRRSDASDRRVV